jgi:hypothetical protein
LAISISLISTSNLRATTAHQFWRAIIRVKSFWKYFYRENPARTAQMLLPHISIADTERDSKVSPQYRAREISGCRDTDNDPLSGELS